jgi:predicted NBD/HSP70 family sugar kinase
MTVGRRPLRPDAKVLPEHGRASNRALVLQTVYRTSGQSRADLARSTALTRVTISELVAGLISDGLIVETGSRSGGAPGKPAKLLDIDPRRYQIVGIDLSEYGLLRGALLDLRGRIVVRSEVRADALVGPGAIEAVASLIGDLIAGAEAPILGIGIGTPGIVDQNGVVVNAPNLEWRDVPLAAVLGDRLGHTVVISNDANAGVLAEFGFGDAGADVLLVKIGRGVGAGLLLGGIPVAGSLNAAGEIGHVVVGPDGGELCSCGKRGCLETWLAVPRLRAALDRAGADRRAVLGSAGERLAFALAPIVGALNLPDVVISGPPELIDGPLLDATRATLNARTLPELHGQLRVRLTGLGDDLVLRGAGLTVVSELLGVS